MRRRRWPDSSFRMPSNTSAVAGIVFAKAVGEIAVDALVFFFEGNGKGENLPFGEAFETTHPSILMQRRGAC